MIFGSKQTCMELKVEAVAHREGEMSGVGGAVVTLNIIAGGEVSTKVDIPCHLLLFYTVFI